MDEDMLRSGIAFVKTTCDKLPDFAYVAGIDSARPDVCTPNSWLLRLNIAPHIFGSAMLPSEGQLQQMRERPWNGVQFSEDWQ